MKWFGHMERKDKEQMVRKVMEAEVLGVGDARGRACLYEWLEGGKHWGLEVSE